MGNSETKLKLLEYGESALYRVINSSSSSDDIKSNQFYWTFKDNSTPCTVQCVSYSDYFKNHNEQINSIKNSLFNVVFYCSCKLCENNYDDTFFPIKPIKYITRQNIKYDREYYDPEIGVYWIELKDIKLYQISTGCNMFTVPAAVINVSNLFAKNSTNKYHS